MRTVRLLLIAAGIAIATSSAHALTYNSGSSVLSNGMSISSVTVTNLGGSTISLRTNSLDIYGISGSSIASFNNSGWLTMPAQPEFMVTSSSAAVDVTGDGTLFTLGAFWNNEIFDNGGNLTNGTFTAPVQGHYLFTAFVQLEHLLVTHDNLTIYLSTTNRDYRAEVGGLLARTDQTVQISILADMNVGDSARIKIYGDSSTRTIDTSGDVRFNVFSGTLLH